MFSNLSLDTSDTIINYPISDSSLPFSDYISKTRAIIEERRTDLQQQSEKAAQIIDANSPFELYPDNPIRSTNQLKYGALLIHGLLDSPFSMRDIGKALQAGGIMSRALLLPGHGTIASDLLRVSYHDWIQAVRYGIETLKREVDHVFLIGYSTGATLSIYHALNDSNIAGIILLSPAVRIKAPVDIAVAWHKLANYFGNNRDWMTRQKETDYAKYQSIPFHAITQVSQLTDIIHDLRMHHAMTSPMYMVLSYEDETISSRRAIDFFSRTPNAESRLLLYSSANHEYADPRIMSRLTKVDSLPISSYSHTALPFAPNNPHYGEHGDYALASTLSSTKYIYGAYTSLDEKIFDLLYRFRLCKQRRRELTFNPDFNFMASEIVSFIIGSAKKI